MKIALTGGTGFIGLYVLKQLLKKGYDVVLIGRHPPNLSEEHQNLSFVQIDLLQEQAHNWISEHKPSHLIHLAWYAEHGKFWTSHLNLDWCEATIRLVRAFVRQGGKRVVISGSCAEYDWSYGFCKENLTPSNPESLYGISKDCSRRLSEKICTMSNVSFAWGRIFLPFGIGENRNRLIPSIIRVFLNLQKPFSINLEQWRDIVPVEIVADGFVFLTEQSSSGTFNICSGQPTQIRELVQKMGKIFGKDPSFLLEKGNLAINENSFLVGDSQKMRSEGWNPSFTIESSLEAYINYINNNEF